MTTFVFPGQGSQAKGMGSMLFDEFEELTAKADDVLGFSIKRLCLEDSDQRLSQTQYTQPALYIINAFSYLRRIKETGSKPDFVAGHSLGEYNALFAAGAFDFETGLRIVKKRGELMSRAAGGGMAAVIGLVPEQLEYVLSQNNLARIDIANYNSPTQIVISGPKADIDAAKQIFEKIQDVKMFVPLKTSGAFHSRYMEGAKNDFAAFLNTVTVSPLEIQAISNVHARPYKQSEIKRNLIEQITSPVKWTESIRYLIGLGEMEFEEVGPGRVLTGLIQRIRTEAEPLVIKSDKEEKHFDKKDFSDTDEIEKNKTEQPRKRFPEIVPSSLGCPEFKREYKLKYAYVSGAMYRGIASKEMVVKMGKAGMMGFLGTGGLELSRIEDAIQYIQKELSHGEAYGMNFLHNPNDPDMEEKTADLFLSHGVKHIEAAAFMNVTSALVKYHAKGLSRDQDGNIITRNKIVAKLSRPEVAEAFLNPAPDRILDKLLAEKKITPEQAELSRRIPVADDICAEADSGGHTDGAVAYALLPAIQKMRDDMMVKHKYSKKVRVGAAGGIGTPEAAAAAFMLGADFIVTGSINQCTVEAGTSDTVKDLLQQMNVQDTEYAPAGDMFELGAKVQVLKKGLFFPARANKLYDLYRQYNSLDEIDEKTKSQIQEKYFKCSFDKVYEDARRYYSAHEIERAERSPKHKMALIFRWYFGYTSRLALAGNEECKVDYQVHCGPALGAFNQWVRGTGLENWRNRHVDEIGKKLMEDCAQVFNRRLERIASI